MLQFRKKGPAAYDLASVTYEGEKYRIIYDGKATYFSGSIVENLVGDKTWYRMPGGGGKPVLYGQILNPAEPATLAALLAKGKRAGNKVTGTITFKDLAKVSPWFSRSAMGSWPRGTRVSYTLTLTSAGLVDRLWSSYLAKDLPVRYEDYEGSTIIVDTRYTGWGGKVSVKAPDPKTVNRGLDR